MKETNDLKKATKRQCRLVLPGPPATPLRLAQGAPEPSDDSGQLTFRFFDRSPHHPLVLPSPLYPLAIEVSHFPYWDRQRRKPGMNAKGRRKFAVTSGLRGRGERGRGGGVERRAVTAAPPKEELGAELRLRAAGEPGADFAHAHTKRSLAPLPVFAPATPDPGDCVGWYKEVRL